MLITISITWLLKLNTICTVASHGLTSVRCSRQQQWQQHIKHVNRQWWVLTDDLLSMDKEVTDAESSMNELDIYLCDRPHYAPLILWDTPVFQTYIMHLKHHCIPALSAAMECCFTAAGYIASVQCRRLQVSVLENMLIARRNKDLLQWCHTAAVITMNCKLLMANETAELFNYCK